MPAAGGSLVLVCLGSMALRNIHKGWYGVLTGSMKKFKWSEREVQYIRKPISRGEGKVDGEKRGQLPGVKQA